MLTDCQSHNLRKSDDIGLTFEFSLNVFTEFVEFSNKNNFIFKGKPHCFTIL